MCVYIYIYLPASLHLSACLPACKCLWLSYSTKHFPSLVCQLQEELHALGRLAIAVDMARREGTPLTEDSAEQLAALRRRDGTPSHRVRSGSPRDGMSGVSSAGSSHVQPQVPRPTPGNVSASSNTTRRPFQGSSFPEREHGLQTSSTQGSMAAAYTSLPPEFTERYMQQYPGRPEAQFHGNQPLQRTNMASNASSVASPRSRMGPSKHRQPWAC